MLELISEDTTDLRSHKLAYGMYCMSIFYIYRILGIIHERKVSRINFFGIVHEKTFAIQPIPGNLIARISGSIHERKFSYLSAAGIYCILRKWKLSLILVLVVTTCIKKYGLQSVASI